MAGIGEVLLILFVILLLFGASSIPKIGGAMGKAIHEFKKASKDQKDA